MAHYVQIPKDLNDIKQKFMFGLTKRQVVSFGIGGVLGIPLFFLTRSTLGVSGAIFVMQECVRHQWFTCQWVKLTEHFHVIKHSTIPFLYHLAEPLFTPAVSVAALPTEVIWSVAA